MSAPLTLDEAAVALGLPGAATDRRKALKILCARKGVLPQMRRYDPERLKAMTLLPEEVAMLAADAGEMANVRRRAG